MNRFDEFQLGFDLPGFEPNEDEERQIDPMEARQISEAARLALQDRQEAGPIDWFEEYGKLIQHGWPWRVAVYIAWAASPKVGRWPKTLRELATDVLGLTSDRQVYVWRKKYATIDTTVAMLQAAPLYDHRRDVIEALIASASAPDYKGHNDRRLFLEMTGDYTPKQKLDVNRSGKGLSLEELSDEELARLAGGNLTPGPFPGREGGAAAGFASAGDDFASADEEGEE